MLIYTTSRKFWCVGVSVTWSSEGATELVDGSAGHHASDKIITDLSLRVE